MSGFKGVVRLVLEVELALDGETTVGDIIELRRQLAAAAIDFVVAEIAAPIDEGVGGWIRKANSVKAKTVKLDVAWEL